MSDDLPDLVSELRATIEGANDGDTECARAVLDLAVMALHSNSIGDEDHFELRTYLAARMQRILGGEGAADALGLAVHTAGRKRGMTTHIPAELAAAFALLRRAPPDGSNPVRGAPTLPLSAENAKEELRKITGADRTTIDDARRNHLAFEIPDFVSRERLLATLGSLAGKMKGILPADKAP